MLISPSKIHSILTSLLSPSSSSGPHTALLIYPNGHLVSSASMEDSSSQQDQDQDQDQDDVGNDEDEEDGQGDEEPYLETQERRRLLLGLASQWNENEGGKMECELGKLHFTYLPLPPSDPVSSIGRESLPSVKPLPIDGFVLVLNGTKEVDWKVLVGKSQEFQDKWRS